MSTKLNPEEQAIRDSLDTHTRMIAYDPQRPHACTCGWTGSGRKGSGYKDHVARKAARAVRNIGASCPIPSPHTIDMHRAEGETLCGGCKRLLSSLQ